MREFPGLLRRALQTLMLLAAGAAQAADPLRFGVGQAWAPPFAEYQQGQLKRGLLLDLMRQIAANAGLQAQAVVLPPKRVDAALAEGQVDLHCPLSPHWFPEPPPAERWTLPLFSLDDVLVGPPGASGTEPDLATLAASVGVVFSYSYPALDAGFASGRLRRDDAPSQQLVLQKLALGRSDYAVVNRLTAQWFNRGRPPARQLVLLQRLATVQTHCLIAAKPRVAPERIHAAVRQLVQSGQLQTILARYR